MKELAGKRALVTGGSRGIGAAIAMALADKGADVAISYANSADRAAEVVHAVENAAQRGVAIKVDHGDAASAAKLVAEAVAALGGLDIVVNNAGIARAGMIEDVAAEDIDAMLAVNVRAPVLICKAAIPYLKEGGRIIIIGSNLADRMVTTGVTVYSMTKSAMVSLTRGLARELGSRDITVNLVQPGATDTEMNPADGPNAAQLNAITALGRFGQPDDIASAVAFLVSPAARQITGTALTVDGGMVS